MRAARIHITPRVGERRAAPDAAKEVEPGLRGPVAHARGRPGGGARRRRLRPGVRCVIVFPRVALEGTRRRERIQAAKLDDPVQGRIVRHHEVRPRRQVRRRVAVRPRVRARVVRPRDHRVRHEVQAREDGTSNAPRRIKREVIGDQQGGRGARRPLRPCVRRRAILPGVVLESRVRDTAEQDDEPVHGIVRHPHRLAARGARGDDLRPRVRPGVVLPRVAEVCAVVPAKEDKDVVRGVVREARSLTLARVRSRVLIVPVRRVPEQLDLGGGTRAHDLDAAQSPGVEVRVRVLRPRRCPDAGPGHDEGREAHHRDQQNDHYACQRRPRHPLNLLPQIGTGLTAGLGSSRGLRGQSGGRQMPKSFLIVSGSKFEGLPTTAPRV